MPVNICLLTIKHLKLRFCIFFQIKSMHFWCGKSAKYGRKRLTLALSTIRPRENGFWECPPTNFSVPHVGIEISSRPPSSTRSSRIGSYIDNGYGLISNCRVPGRDGAEERKQRQSRVRFFSPPTRLVTSVNRAHVHRTYVTYDKSRALSIRVSADVEIRTEW